ncbi:MAG: glycosyltransferase [Gemmataceae bacterium]
MNPAFSILIINYNGAKHLGPCLAALEVQTLPRYQYEVIVLDNASPDGSASLVENEYPHVRLIRSASNLGFAEGNNVAKSYARGEWLVLLNNDTIPDPHWLAEMQREVISNTANGVERIVSKLVLGPDGKSINSGGVVLLRSGWAADEGVPTGG